MAAFCLLARLQFHEQLRQLSLCIRAVVALSFESLDGVALLFDPLADRRQSITRWCCHFAPRPGPKS